MEIHSSDVLMVVDIQHDFCTGGALAVPGGEEVVEVVHGIAPLFRHIILTQDWHPAGHQSFASAHEGKKPFDEIPVSYGLQRLWPDHCVQGTVGADFHQNLHLPQAELIQRKGYHREIDSYSAFFENDRETPTGIEGYLRLNRMKRIFLAGLAYDYCVAYSALDARRLGFETVIVRDACRAIDIGGSVAAMEAEFAKAGVALVNSCELRAAQL